MRERHDRRTGTGGPARLFTTLARDLADVTAAQRLRYRVFGEELGARLPSAAEAVDRDDFDVHCEHLILRDRLTDEVVGACRDDDVAVAHR
jgi:putative hemolysin